MGRKIVSFTSYPARIQRVDKVIESIINQTVLPDKIVLYLSCNEFQDRSDLFDYSQYKKYGFEIHWYEENLGPHKKYYYAMQEYPDDIIITIDDDILYKEDAIETLLSYHEQFPKAVIARRAHLITCLEDGTIAPYAEWYGECSRYIGIPRMDLMATGCGGVLYPPHVFQSEIFNRETIIGKCRYTDDIWLKVMEAYSGIPTVLAQRSFEDVALEELSSNGLYIRNTTGGNDSAVRALLEEYPYVYESNKELIDNIFSDGRLLHSECEGLELEDMRAVVDALVNRVNDEEELLIYGAGVVAGRIYKVLKQKNEIQKIKAFIVRDPASNKSTIGSIPVRSYKEFTISTEKIMIGLLHTKQKDVYGDLVEAGIDVHRILTLDALENKALQKVTDLFMSSSEYWEERYSGGGNSGSGSYDLLSEFKAEVINRFVEENKIETILEWGCGDGNQLALAKYPQYIGYDVSKSAIEMCRKKFELDKSKLFIWLEDEVFENIRRADLALSLDVIYHLVEDEIYESYMEQLFLSSMRFVCIYSNNDDKKYAKHVRCRRFTEYVSSNFKEWKLIQVVRNKYPYNEKEPDNTSWSDFYFYKKGE